MLQSQRSRDHTELAVRPAATPAKRSDTNQPAGLDVAKYVEGLTERLTLSFWNSLETLLTFCYPTAGFVLSRSDTREGGGPHRPNGGGWLGPTD
jgi:hypothetical protein